MEQHTEEWKQYELYPCYWVSNHGRVKRLYKNANEKYLKPCVAHKGYLWIDLVRAPKRIHKMVHVMVAESFIPNPENKPMVDHINEIKDDNRLENLRWVNNSENQQNITTLRKSNTSGCVGVESKKGSSTGIHWAWGAKITLMGKRIELGYFKKYEDAVQARRDAEIKYFGEFAPKR